MSLNTSRLFTVYGSARPVKRAAAWHVGLLTMIFLATSLWDSPRASATQTPKAQEILQRADRIRFPGDPFQVDVTVTNEEQGRNEEVRKYRILSKGHDRTLVQTLAPAIDRGQILLMRDHDLWAFLPNISQPIRLPLSQRLTGQVANGDLARANFVGDYSPKLLGQEKLRGDDYYVLELNAVDRWVTYHQVKYWVHTKSFRPYKAEYYALSGRLLKTARYLNFQRLGGDERPSRLVIDDALRNGRRSIMDYAHMRLRNLPDKYFNKDYLKKLSR